MRDFDYYAPNLLEEALSLLDARGSESKILAGGTDLIVQMKMGRTSPTTVIDVKKIPELNRIEQNEAGDLFIGASVSLNKIIAHPLLANRFNMLREACCLIGSLQLRSRATVGGNISNAAPSADTAPPLLCLDARAVVANSTGIRAVPLSNFFLGPGKTIMTTKDLLMGIEIPLPQVCSSGSYLRHTPRMDMDIAVVGVAALLIFDENENFCRDARLALGAVAPKPMRVLDAEAALVGRAVSDDTLEMTADIASNAASPISDIRASAEYRRELIKVLTRRTLRRAWEGSKIKDKKRIPIK